MHATTENSNHGILFRPIPLPLPIRQTYAMQPDNRLVNITIHQIKPTSAKRMQQLPASTDSKMTTTTSYMTVVKAKSNY